MLLEATFSVSLLNRPILALSIPINPNILCDRWQGSIYKLLWPNLVVYVLLYYVLSFVYLFALDAPGKE